MRLGRVRQEFVARALAHIPRSALQLVPGSSLAFGPPRRSATLRDYLARHPGEWHPVLPEQICDYTPARSLPSDAARLAEKLPPPRWPEAGVAIIPESRVLDVHAWPVGQDDTFLYEFAFLGERSTCPIFLIKRLPSKKHLVGSVLNLGSCWAAFNYGHFLLDALPRLELFLRAGFRVEAMDHILLPAFSGPSAKKIIERLGLPRQKIVPLEPGTQFFCDHLYQPSFPGSSAFYRPVVPEFYRRPEFWGQPATTRRRRLYVPRRSGTRRIVNEPEIARLLENHGFETVDFRQVADDRALFSEAEIVCGPHGAGLANVVFCQPGATLLELMPSNHVFPFYYSAARAGGLDYWALLGQAEDSALQDDFVPPTDAHFTVNPCKLEEILAALPRAGGERT